MKQTILLLAFISSALLFNTQATSAQSDSTSVHQVITDLFDAMRESDGEKLGALFAENAKMNSVYTNNKGEHIVRSEEPAAFAEAVGTPHEGVWDEKLLSVEIRIDGNLAQVWTPYEFYLDDKFQHCGVNAFHLIRTKEGWKILQLSDTRRRSSCDKLREK